MLTTVSAVLGCTWLYLVVLGVGCSTAVFAVVLTSFVVTVEDDALLLLLLLL